MIATILAFTFCLTSTLQARERLSLFTDCECDKTLIKQELNYLNHTVDPATAHVNLFIVTNYLSNGGRVYDLQFKGQGELEGNSLKFKVSTTPVMTGMERETLLVKRIKLGLAGFLAGTDYADLIDLTTVEEEIELTEAEVTDEEEAAVDNWNDWIFSARANYRAETESQRSRNDIRLNFNADRTTPELRLRSRTGLFYRIDEIDQKDTDPIVRIRRDQWQTASIVRSISNHWSVGLFGSWRSSTFFNFDNGFRLSPAIEYNLFDYKEVPFKELTVAYRAGWWYNDYYNTTIFNQTEEHLARQSLDVELRLRQRWGSILAGVSAGNYLHDIELNRMEMDVEADVRLFRGLSFTVDVEYDIINDQINLARQESSLEDVLLGQAQLATNYSADIRFGFSYTFGSLYNNIINTRL